MAGRSGSRIPLAWCLLLSIIYLDTVKGQTRGQDQQSQLQDSLGHVLDSIDSGLDFFDSHKEQLNLDAIIGSRLVQGQLSVVQQRLKSSSDPNNYHHDHPLVLSSDHLLRRISEIQAKSKRVSDDALPYIATNQAEYYRRIGPIIKTNFWTQDHPSRDVDVSLVTTPRFRGEVMHEADSDNCLTELFGTGKNTQTCHVSRQCWKLMTSQGYRYYSLSHQVFYLQIGESYGCFHGDFLSYTDALAAGFCANIMSEAQSISDQDYPQDRRDLFMEQQALCGIMGYRQFFRHEWLSKVLQWQWQAQGCWGDHHPAPAAGSTGRIKREERQLPDGCECHRTAVALGALGQYVRYLLEAIQ